MNEKLSAYVSLDLEKIMDNYSKVEKETVDLLKAKLQEQTSTALRQNLFEGHNPFPDVKLEGTTRILYRVATLKTMSEMNLPIATSRHLVLGDDGKLYNFKVIGEGDEDGEWKHEGILEEEAEPRDYINSAPPLIRKIQKTLSE